MKQVSLPPMSDHRPSTFTNEYPAPTIFVTWNIEEVQYHDEMSGKDITGYNYEWVRIPSDKYRDYPTLVSAIIRSRYTSDQVEAIVLNHGDGNPDHEAEYTALQQWRTEAKRIAKQVLAQK